MNDLEKLKSELAICDIHQARIKIALNQLADLLPLSANSIANLSDEELGFLELLSSRFAKLHDTIGNKIFPLLLKLLREYSENQSFIDRLNKLEKLEIITTVAFWDRMWETRNSITHEYPEDPQYQVININGCFKAARELIEFWENLKTYINNKVLKS